MDPIERLADEELFRLSADINVQLEKGSVFRPIAYMLAEARKTAIKAVLLFMDADTNDAGLMLRLQSELKIYDGMVAATRSVVNQGSEARQRIKEKDREELQNVVSQMSPEERRLYNMEPQRTD